MQRKWYGSDTQLQVRMFITMFLLAAVYLAFLAFLFNTGMGYAPMVVIIGGLLLAQYYFSDKMVIWSSGARIVDEAQAPRLHAIVGRLAQQADLPKPKVAIMDTAMPNAFATGRSPGNAVVAVTTGLMNQLDEPELEGVIAHELSHVKNRDVMVMTIASFFSTLAFILMRSGLFYGMWGGGFGGGRGRRDNSGNAVVLIYLVSLLVWLISFILIRTLSRYRESAADRGSAIITGAPSQLASALMKISGTVQRIPQRDLRQVEGMNAFFIVPALSGNAFMELFATHPSVEKRLERLRQLQAEMERVA